MKLHFLNLLIISLSILYKVLAEIDDIPDCKVALGWKGEVKECCVSDFGPFFCNANKRIVSIKL